MRFAVQNARLIGESTKGHVYAELELVQGIDRNSERREADLHMMADLTVLKNVWVYECPMSDGDIEEEMERRKQLKEERK